eukprot:5929384-Lingulodinium_polyedra.AAC.1
MGLPPSAKPSSIGRAEPERARLRGWNSPASSWIVGLAAARGQDRRGLAPRPRLLCWPRRG